MLPREVKVICDRWNTSTGEESVNCFVKSQGLDIALTWNLPVMFGGLSIRKIVTQQTLKVTDLYANFTGESTPQLCQSSCVYVIDFQSSRIKRPIKVS